MIDWHARFVQQAVWTRSLRAYLFTRIGLADARRVLEVGCGSGAILADLTTAGAVHGLDWNSDRLSEARTHARSARLTCGNALALPYLAAAFDVTFCHFLLLWVRDPLQALQEMKRVTRPGGAILALAEPDYDHRQDRPESLAPLGRWQTESLRHQGADPGLGRRLADLFVQAGIQIVETGTLQPQAERMLSPEERELEWSVLEADLAGIIPEDEVHQLKELDRLAWERGERVFFVPTYFAWGQIEKSAQG